MAPTRARAILFDLDGTLMDSEPATDRAILEVMARHGVPGASLPPFETRGRTWSDIVTSLSSRYGTDLDRAALGAELETAWIALCECASSIPGASRILREAAAWCSVAVVSSSSRKVIDAFLDRLDASGIVDPDARIGAESIVRSKPDPEGFRLAASRLVVEPEECVVFEDSRAGLMAAKAAGMRAILVLHSAAEPDACRAIADASCRDYDALPVGFFADLARGALDLSRQSWT